MHLTPIKAIRAKCLDCCAGSYKEVTLCKVHNCSLYPYRFGKRPNMGMVTPEDHITICTPETPHVFAAESKNEDPLV